MSGRVPPEPPYRWHPDGARRSYGRPEPGQLVPWRHLMWRVIEVTDVPVADLDEAEARWFKPGVGPYHLVLRPADRGDDVRDRNHDVHLRCRPISTWDTYEDEHYPVCVECREPSPCRARMAARHSGQAAEKAAEVGERAEMGACTACGELVSSRQRTIEFPGLNLDAPSAPSPVFHLRQRCRSAAWRYEKKWVPAEPGRLWRLECPGKTRRHADAWDCTEGAVCPGSGVLHRDQSVCDGFGGTVAGGARFPCVRCVDARAAGQAVESLPGDPAPRRKRQQKPAVPDGYVVPAARLGAAVHVTLRPARKYPKPVKVPGRAVVAQFPAGAVLGWTVCGMEMLAEDCWVGYRADPREDGSLCGGCGEKAVVGL